MVDQTRVWVSLLQEESQKWEAAQEEARRREESRLAAEAATSKAASPVVAGSHPAEAEVTEEVEPVKAPTVKVKEERECIISPGTVSSPPESKEEIVEEEPTPPPKVSLEKTEVKKKRKRRRQRSLIKRKRKNQSKKRKQLQRKTKSQRESGRAHPVHEEGGDAQTVEGEAPRGRGGALFLHRGDLHPSRSIPHRTGGEKIRLGGTILLRQGSIRAIPPASGPILLVTGSTQRSLRLGGAKTRD